MHVFREAKPAPCRRGRLGALVVLVALGVLAASGAAGAEVQSFEDFARLFGDTAEAKTACRFAVDSFAVDAVGQPFQDSLDADVAAEKLGLARADAAARRERVGAEAFCAEMLSRYGLDGTVAKGLLKP